MGNMRGAAPCARNIASSPKLLEAMICAGPGVSPGITNSSPVAMMATTGRRATVISGVFIEAVSAMSAGVKRRGAAI